MKIPRITPQQAWDLRPTFVDARNPHAWAEAEQQLPGALRLSAEEATAGPPRDLPTGPIVAYCT